MIRDYKPSDYTQIKELLKQNDMFYAPIDDEERLNEKIEKYPGTIVVYEEDGRVVGCCYFIVDPTHEFVMHLCVDKAQRRKGIGKAIMEEVENRIRTMSKRKNPALLIDTNNAAALDFYKELGWEVHDERKYFILEKKL